MLSDRLITEVLNEENEILFSFEYENYDGPIINDLKQENLLEDHFSIFPNPVNNQLFFSEELIDLEIYHINGKRIMSINNPCYQIDLSIINSGMYIIKGTTLTGKKVNKRFVKIDIKVR